MATFDFSEAVNNILSSRGKTAQKTTTATAQKKTRPGGRLGGAAGLGSEALQEVSSTAGQVISGFTQDLTKLPALKNVLGDTLDTSTPIPERQFNPFNPVDAHGARVMASKLIELADSAGADGLAVAAGVTDSFSALLGGVGGLVPGLGGQLMTTVTTGTAEIAREIVNTVGQNVLGRVGLSEHALMLFITHYPSAHQQISLDPFDVREPNLVSRLGSKAWPAEENQLNFWREDALLNDHHGRWHDVNPWQGRPTEPGKTYQRASHPIIGDRNGELFSYMHMQMLARYDAERLAMDLDRVEPFDDYDAEIPQGYKPGDRMGKKVKDGFYVYRERPPGVKLTSLTSEPSEDLNDLLDNVKKFDKALNEAASQGYFLIPDQGSENNIAVTDDNLGNTVQGSIGSVDWPYKDNLGKNVGNNGKKYGNHHASGHVHVTYFDDKQRTQNAMIDLYATSRDPMFWRWHKHVDNIIQKWRQAQNPHDDLTSGARVKIRSEDIILCGELELPDNIDGGMLGDAAFGYHPKDSEDKNKENRWDTDFSESKVTATLAIEEKGEKKSGGKTESVTVTTTKVLWTEIKTRTIRPLEVGPEQKIETGPGEKPPQQLPREVGPAVDETIDYLSHDDFSYFIRLQNLTNETQTVTVRIFLAPEELIQKDPRDNTAWIEMDRFMYQLEDSERAVVFRPAKLSAVIRKPAVGPKELENPELRKSGNNWCDCGWPYTLLLPRGTKAGMDFRLMVMLSGDDLAMDYTGEDGTSMSHCGLQDRKYPDKRPMGYPFDRPLPDKIDSIIAKHENWASRKIQIRCRS